MTRRRDIPGPDGSPIVQFFGNVAISAEGRSLAQVDKYLYAPIQPANADYRICAHQRP